jgi:two-component system response regulator MtrA
MSARDGQLRILVADDDDDVRALVSDILRADGHEVSEVSDGAQLLFVLRRADQYPDQRPDVVVADIVMPGLTGLGVVGALQLERISYRVVLMTMLRDDLVEITAERLGVVAVLKKPLDPDDLRVAVLTARCAHEKDWPRTVSSSARSR